MRAVQSVPAAVMTFVVIVFGYFFFAYGWPHHIFFLSVDWLFSFDFGMGAITLSLFFAIDIIFAEVSILWVYKLGAAHFHFGDTLVEWMCWHLISGAGPDGSIWFIIVSTMDATYFFPLWHCYIYLIKIYNLQPNRIKE